MELFFDSLQYVVSLFSTSIVPYITVIIFVTSLIFLAFAKKMRKRWPDTLSDSKIKKIKLVLIISSVMMAVFFIYFTVTIIVLSLGIIKM